MIQQSYRHAGGSARLATCLSVGSDAGAGREYPLQVLLERSEEAEDLLLDFQLSVERHYTIPPR